MFSLRNINTRVRDAAAAAAASAKKPRRRVRFVEKGNKLIAQVDELRGLKWVPTEVIEEVDLTRMARAVAMEAAIKRGQDTGAVYVPALGAFQNVSATGEDPVSPFGQFQSITAGGPGPTGSATPWGHFQMRDADTAGFWKKVKKAAKKVAKNKVVKVIAKAHTVPLKAAHKITHGKNSPIRKAELAMQKTIAKNLPIAKPFINVHNKLAGATHKLIEGKKVDAKKALPNKQDIAELAEANKRVKADAITKALKKVPKDQQDEVRKALVSKATSWIVISPKTGLTHTLKL